MDKGRDKPRVRFKGYTDAWEQRKLGDYCDMFNGDRSSKYPNADDMVSDGIPFINAGDLENGTVNLMTCNRISREKYNDLGGAKLQRGDIIYCLRGTLGKNAFIDNFDEGTVASSLVALRPKNIDGKYLYFILNSDIEYRQRIVRDEGAAQPNLSAKSVSEYIIPVPSGAEQQQVSAYFSKLDHLITLHQRKCEEIKKLKKYMLQKMFPQNGANVPEIRFDGFTDAWEQRKLGELMNVTSVKRIHQSDWTDSGVRFLRARDIVAASKNEEPDDYLYISKEKYEEYSAISGKVDIDDLLVTGVGTIGVPYLVENTEPLYFKDGNIIWFQNQNEIDGKFLYYSFIGNGIQSFIKASAGTGTVGTYTIDTGKKTPIQLPLKDEQKKIGEYFSRLDYLITLHQHKCEELQNIKKFMLQNMFVQGGE